MSALETRRWAAATFVLVAAFASTVLAPPRDACGAEAVACPPGAVAGVVGGPASVSVALRTRAEHLVARGEIGEARELAALAVRQSPGDPAARAFLASLREDDTAGARVTEGTSHR
ncbi:MAG: hypothetical protein JWP97_3931 [Labilithrix sp.]|nr:hypothetical protein [Labilithrix sp.]